MATKKLKVERIKTLNEQFRDFCNSDEVMRSYTIHNKCKPKGFNTITAFPDSNGKYANDIKANLENILNSYIPDSGHPQIGDNLDHLIDQLPEEEIEIRPEKIEAILFGINPHKAPGEDGISPIIIQKVYPIIKEKITLLFKALIKLRYFPKAWKGIIVLIPKANTSEDSPIAKCYRPIALLIVLGKIFEAILTNYLNIHLYRNQLMSNNQFGFLKQTSTLDALFDFKSFLDCAMAEGELVLTVSLDISGAFDNAAYYLILLRMIERNCCKSLVELFKSYFEDREVQVNFADLNVCRPQSQGAPQGSNSGPFL